MKKYNKLSAAFLSLLLVAVIVVSQLSVSAATYTGTKEETDGIISALNANNASATEFSYGYEWDILNLARSGASISDARKAEYVADVIKNLGTDTKFAYASNQAKVVLTLQALGYDASNVEGVDFLAPLKDTSYGLSAYATVLPYIVLALYNADSSYDTSAYTSAMLAYQKEDGGFGAWGYGEDVDTTAMIVQGLAPYYSTNTSIKTAVDAAISYMASQMDANGYYTLYGYSSTESTAMVVMALTSVGINPVTDTRFIVNGTSIYERLFEYYDGNGAFAYDDAVTQAAGYTITMMEYEPYQAVIATSRLLYGKTTYFDFSDLVNTFSYTVLSGASTSVDIASAKDASFSIRIDCPVEKFVSLTVDGTTVSASNYTVTSGSTIITFASAYVKTLATGSHEIAATFTDGVTKVTVTVSNSDTTSTSQTVTSPATGE